MKFFKKGGSTRPVTPRKGIDSGSMNSSHHSRESETKRQVKPSNMVRTSMMTSEEYRKMHEEYQKQLKDLANDLTDDIDWEELKTRADHSPEDEWDSRDGDSGTARYTPWLDLDKNPEYQTRVLTSPDPEMATNVLEYLIRKKVESNLGKGYEVQKVQGENKLQILSHIRSYSMPNPNDVLAY